MAEMTAEEAAEWGKTLDFPTVWAALLKLGEKVDKTTENINKSDDKIDRAMETVNKMGEKVDKTTENLDKLDDKTTENDNRLDDKIDRMVETVNRMGEKVDKTTENLNKLDDKTTENDNRLDEKIDRMVETVNRMGEKVDKTTENLNKLGEKVDRVTGNVGGLNQSMGELVETLFAPHLGEKFDVYQYNLRRTYGRVPLYDDTNRLRGEIDILLSNTTICMAVEIKRWLDKMDQVDRHIKRMQLISAYPPAEVRGKKLLGAIAAAVVNPDVREYAEQNGFFILELMGDDVRLLEPPKNFKPKEW